MTAGQVMGAIGGSFIGAYLLYDLIAHRKVFGGKTVADIPSLAPSWKEATELRFLNCEMEGSPDNPILLNPFRRNVPARIRNKDQFPTLDA